MLPYTEPRLRRDFSGIITAYVDFLKGSFKNIVNVFLTFNFILILSFFLINYLLSDGLSGIAAIAQGDFGGYMDYTEVDQNSFIQDVGIFIQLSLLILMIIFNAAIAGAYIRYYEKYEGQVQPTFKDIFQVLLQKFFGFLGMIALAAIAFIPAIIILFLSLIIPFLGVFAFIYLFFVFLTGMGLSFFAYAYHDKLNIFDAFAKGWSLMFSKFWKATGASLIVALIIYILLGLFQAVPAIIIGVLEFNSTEDNIALQDNIYIKAVNFIFYALNSIAVVLSFLLIFLMQGYLYLNLHETKFNLYLQSRIRKIGQAL